MAGSLVVSRRLKLAERPVRSFMWHVQATIRDVVNL